MLINHPGWFFVFMTRLDLPKSVGCWEGQLSTMVDGIIWKMLVGGDWNMILFSISYMVIYRKSPTTKNMGKNMVQYLHFRILEFPLNIHFLFSIIYGIIPTPLTNSYVSRWERNHQPECVLLSIQCALVKSQYIYIDHFLLVKKLLVIYTTLQ